MARCNCSPRCSVCGDGPCDCTCTEADKAAFRAAATIPPKDKDAHFTRPAKAIGPDAYSYRDCAEELDRLTQPTQSVDVEKVREVIAELNCTSHFSPQSAADFCEQMADKLTAALQEKGNG